jgi:alpha-1,6-mannosyltransferase
LAASFTHVVATTEFAGREFVELGIKNLRQIPLGVDLQCFSPEHRSLKARRELIKGAKYLLVHVGRLSPEKEPQRSIEALRELHHRGIDARLVVVGSGPMWSKLRKQAAGLPVDFLGYVADRKRVASILANADVSIAPGPLETFCLSALESLASGTPTVASEDSAVKEFLALLQKNPAGAIAANNEIAFADAITSLLDRPRLRFVARGIAESLPWDETVRMMLILHGIFEVGDHAPHAHTRKRMRVA